MTNFLLVEDDDIDYWAVQRGFRRLGVNGDIIRVTDGTEALDVLSEGAKTPAFLSSLVILLDLNLPCMNGYDFLSVIGSKPNMSNVPVIITTTSDDDRDRKLAKTHNVAAYINKADLVNGLEKAFQDLGVHMHETVQNKASRNHAPAWEGRRNRSLVMDSVAR